MGNVLRDLRYGVRLLIRQPAFTIVVVITLALGIGANTAIFTVVNAALIRALPYRDPESLVHLLETQPQKQFPVREASYPDFVDWQRNEAFSGMAAYAGGGNSALTGRGANERLELGAVTPTFFNVLGVDPILGRTFLASEDQPEAPRVAVLSHGLWQRLFASDPNVVGESIQLDGMPFTVIGVLPPSFHFAPRGSAQLWIAWRPSEARRARRYMHWINVIGRLKPGKTLDEAQRLMEPIGSRIAQDYPDSHAGTAIRIVPLQEKFVGPIKSMLIALSVAVGIVLLITCANLANLLLARATVRRREIGIRVSLGATRWDLMRQMLIESVLLAVIGGAVGFVLAQWGVDALIAAVPEARLATMPFLRGLKLDSRLLAFTATLSVLAGIVFGLAPAYSVTRDSLQDVLKEGGRSLGASSRHGLRSLLVVAEVALCFVLLVGAGLMIRSVSRLLSADPGFDTSNLLTMRLSLPASKYTDAVKMNAFHTRLMERLKGVPGVVSAATVRILPTIGGNTTKIIVDGQPPPLPGEGVELNLRDVSAGYFQALGIPIDHGRAFDERDNLTSPRVLLVNRTLAERIFPGEDPVGRRIAFGTDDPERYEIVGVVGDEKVNSIDGRVTPVVYTPYLQDPNPATSLMVKTTTDPHSMAATIRSEAMAIEGDLSIYNVQTMDELIAGSPATFARRYPAILLGLFAGLAVILSATGLYGVISYSVSQQTRELGIRVALGAARRDILKLVMVRGVVLAAGGLGAGLLLALLGTQLLGSLLFGVSPTDPATYMALGALLAGIALLSCYIPARRATTVDPLVALRNE